MYAIKYRTTAGEWFIDKTWNGNKAEYGPGSDGETVSYRTAKFETERQAEVQVNRMRNRLHGDFTVVKI